MISPVKEGVDCLDRGEMTYKRTEEDVLRIVKSRARHEVGPA
jgi:hypothetical protein